LNVLQDQQHGVVQIDVDGLRAHYCVSDAAGIARPSEDELRSLLSEAGVIRGIDEGVVKAIAAGEVTGSRILVASGRAPVSGVDGRVEFPAVLAGRGERPGVRRNMRDGEFIKQVSRGTVVAVVHPPTPGIAGESVRGEPLPAHDGVPARIEAGENVQWSPTEPDRLLAACDGHLALGASGRVEVQTVVTIPGNLDLSIGNIDFCGSLLVRGDILSEFTVRVGGSVDVHGNVEDSVIHAGGKVTVRNGFFGHGRGSIEAGGDVHVHHVLNQSIHGHQDVYIETEAVNATIRAEGSIVAPRAVIAGGSMDALRDINAGVLGSEDGGQAKLRAGKRGRVLERLGQIDRESKHAEKQLGDVKAAVFRLVKLKVDGVALTCDQEQTLAKLQEVQKALPGRLQALAAERCQMQSELQKKSDARIEVHDTVYENVLIDINNVRKVIDSAIQGVIFTERAGTIEIQSR